MIVLKSKANILSITSCLLEIISSFTFNFDQGCTDFCMLVYFLLDWSNILVCFLFSIVHVNVSLLFVLRPSLESFSRRLRTYTLKWRNTRKGNIKQISTKSKR